MNPWELADAAGIQGLCHVLAVVVAPKFLMNKKMRLRDAMYTMRMVWYAVTNVVSSD